MKQKLSTYDLKLWLPLVTVALSLFIASFQVFTSYQQRIKDIETTGRENSNAIVFQLSHFVNYALANHSNNEARSIIASATLIDNVNLALIINSNFQVEYASRQAWIGKDVRELLPASYLAIIDHAMRSQQKESLLDNAHQLSAASLSVSILHPTRNTKILFVDYDLSQQFERALKKVITDVIPLLSITLIMLLVLLLMMKRLVTQPLHQLYALATRIKSHQADIDNPLQGNNELAEIGQALSEAGMTLREDIRQLSDRENRLGITLNSIGDGVIVTDEHGMITRINPTAAILTGWEMQAALSKPVTDVFKTSSLPTQEQLNPVQQVLATRSIVELHNHTILVSKDNEKYHIYQTAAPIFEEDNKLIGVVLVFQNVSREYQLRNDLRKNMEFMENLLRISPSITFVLKPLAETDSFHLSYISPSISRYSDTDPESWLETNSAWKTRIHPDDLPNLLATFHSAIDHPGHVTATEFRYRNRHGDYLNFKTFFAASFENNQLDQIVGTAIDISEQTQVLQENQLLGNILERSLNEIYIFDSETLEFIQVNYGARHNLGYSMEELSQLTPLDLKKDFSKEEYTALIQPLRSGEINKLEFECLHYRKNGTAYPSSVSIQLDHSQNRSVFIAIVTDLSEKKQTESRIDFLAYHDVLTELPNRVLLDDRLNQALSRSERKHEQFAVLYLDLDRFKVINDTLGHAIGDELLIEVAKRLKSQIREEDTVSRTGGDEFTIILLDSDSKGAAHAAQKLLKLIAAPYQIGQHTLHVTVSIGISLYPDNGDNAAVLKQKADNAMYRAKETERNYYQFFTEEMHDQMLHRMHLESQLHLAIERQEFSLVYQPQLDIEQNKVIGAEALLRWTHPHYGPISPAEFIPIAEDCGLINQIGSWVLQEALSQTSKWIHHIDHAFVIAINLSAMQFRNANLVDEICLLLQQYGLKSSDIELEITESIAMDDLNHTIKQMQRLADAGIQLSLDDFGTGFSSLNSLKKFPIHKLKIDKSFIDDMLSDKDDEAIVDAIITLAQTLGLITIAEGVETQAQFETLRNKGCEAIQGYLFSRPIKAKELFQLVTKHRQTDEAIEQF